MKILSFAVPCYNSEAYMRKCIDSLLPGGEDVEIIIVDDGSAMAQLPLRMNMKQSIRGSAARSIRRMQVMVVQ